MSYDDDDGNADRACLGPWLILLVEHRSSSSSSVLGPPKLIIGKGNIDSSVLNLEDILDNNLRECSEQWRLVKWPKVRVLNIAECGCKQGTGSGNIKTRVIAFLIRLLVWWNGEVLEKKVAGYVAAYKPECHEVVWVFWIEVPQVIIFDLLLEGYKIATMIVGPVMTLRQSLHPCLKVDIVKTRLSNRRRAHHILRRISPSSGPHLAFADSLSNPIRCAIRTVRPNNDDKDRGSVSGLTATWTRQQLITWIKQQSVLQDTRTKLAVKSRSGIKDPKNRKSVVFLYIWSQVLFPAASRRSLLATDFFESTSVKLDSQLSFGKPTWRSDVIDDENRQGICITKTMICLIARRI
ncbi:hypothetical protein KCU85_g478, partial [Aureobasidium melanogenum]